MPGFVIHQRYPGPDFSLVGYIRVVTGILDDTAYGGVQFLQPAQMNRNDDVIAGQ